MALNPQTEQGHGARRLDDKYLAHSGRHHMTGIQALVRLPLDVRRDDRAAQRSSAVFISGYEGSPLGGYDLELAAQRTLLEAHDVVFRPAVNEELAVTAVQGSQLAATMPDKRVQGVTAFWYGKSPGLDRASDALRHANLGGTHPFGGAVALVGDDTTAKSSTVPGASEHLLADLGIPTLYPANPQEVLDFGRHAVMLSRYSGLWAALKLVTNVADGSGSVILDPDRPPPVMPPSQAHDEHVVTARLMGVEQLRHLEESRNGARLERARRYAEVNGLNQVLGRTGSSRIGIVAAGKVFTDLRQALAILGLDDRELVRRGVRLMKLGMIHPLERASLVSFAAGLQEIIVVEEKRVFVEVAFKDILFSLPDHPLVWGKLDADGQELFPSAGALTPDSIAARLASHLGPLGDFPTLDQWTARRPASRPRIQLPVVARPPYFCSGCPHNTSTKVPPGTLVGGGIGCHTLALTMPADSVGEVMGVTQMGGEGAQWIGMAPFLARNHIVQNLGDGTFHHSGSLSVRAAVAAGNNITYKLLYNSVVAMTGGQEAAGRLTVPAITRAMAAEGVRRIIITTDRPKAYKQSSLAPGTEVWHRDRLLEAQEVLAATPGVTMLIHDQECAAELRRKRRRGLAPQPPARVMINERLCEGCGDCATQSNCLSLHPLDTEFGRKTMIDQSSCNVDYSCLKGDCPSFVTIRRASKGLPVDRKARHLDGETIPLPRQNMFTGDGVHTTRIVGVGGTGVVTLSQILSVAATLDGKFVACLDQTGLAQKGGSVVSDVKTSTRPIVGSNCAADGEVDLYLGADLLVAADPANLSATDPAKTVAVVSTTEVPTGPMVTDIAVSFPASEHLTGLIAAATRPDASCYFDARSVSERILGDDQHANILLAGAAWQLGALPLSAEAIEEAIALNRVRVEQNVQAFRWGRQLVANPNSLPEPATGGRAQEHSPAESGGTGVPAQIAAIVSADADSALRHLVDIRVADLIRYQDAAYARAYAEFVERIRAMEVERVPGISAVVEAVARNLYKLMAYKDEYEVADLSLRSDLGRAVSEAFGPHARVSYSLRPPLLAALGVKRKIAVGQWFRAVFTLLRMMRRLRGTPWDPFGHTEVRREERRLIDEYRETVESAAKRLQPDNCGLVAQIADLPDMIRGYEGVKLRTVAQYRQTMAVLLAELEDASEETSEVAG